MNKVSVLVFFICAMALCFIGGYISVLHYEHSIAKSPPLFDGKDSSAIRDQSITTDIAILQSIKIHAKPYLRSEVTTESLLQTDQQLQIITKSPTFSPTMVVTKPRKPIQSALISSMKPVTSDVRGNLGPASAITNERMEDWLTDRWQAARNMGGDPIPGEHWVEVDLQDLYNIDKVMIDWEVAFSNDWTIQVKSTERGAYTLLYQSKDIARTERPHKMHVLQHIDVPKHRQSLPARYVKLVIHRPATRFGASIWRLQIWGAPVENS